MDQEAKPNYIYITKSKIWAGEVQFDWGGGDLGFILRQIKNRWGLEKIHVVLGNEVSLVWTWEVLAQNTTKDYLLDQAKKLTAEDLSLYHFSWNVVRVDRLRKYNVVQVTAVYPGLWENLEFVAKENGIQILSVEPIGVVLAKQVKATEPRLVWWLGQEKLAVVVKEDLAYLVQEVGTSTDQQRVEISLKAKNMGLTLNQKDELEVVRLDFGEEPVSLESASQVAKPEEQAGLTRPTQALMKTQVGKTPPMVRRVVMLGLVSLVVMGLVLAMGLKLTTNREAPILEKPQVQEVPASPTPTSMPTIAMEDLKVNVLNGSGKVGEAKRVADLVSALGVKEVQTGNADKYDYQETEVSFKTSVAESLRQAILAKLAAKYQVTESQEPVVGSEDVVIFVGSLIAE